MSAGENRSATPAAVPAGAWEGPAMPIDSVANWPAYGLLATEELLWKV